MPAPEPIPVEDASDADVATRILAGDRRAEAELVRRFARRVELYGLRHLRDPDRARDLAQDVMLMVLKKLRAGDVNEPAKIGSFILGTARNTARDARRSERRRAEVHELASLETDVALPPVDPVAEERLAAALASLSEQQRTVVILTFHHGHDAKDIAEAFGLTPGNVRVIRHRAVERLRAELDVPAGGSP